MTNHVPILIGGATGSTGRVATKLLLQRGFPVRAFVHKEDDRSHQLEVLGAEIFVGDMLDLHAVRRALGGIARAYFVYPMRPGLAQATVHFAQAAREAHVEFILNLSQKSARPDARSESALQHWVAERVFDWSGTPVTHLRPTIFHDWLLMMRIMIRQGLYGVPFGRSGRFAPIAAEDQGAVIAEILANPAPHVSETYPLYGPVEMTAPDIAKIVSATLGKPVRYEQITAAQWVASVTGHEIPFLIQHIDALSHMQHDGEMAGTSNFVEQLIGRKPMSVRDFVEKHRDFWE